MVSASLTSKTLRYGYINFKLNNTVYNNVKVSLLDNLCRDLVFLTDFPQQHKSVTFHFRRNKPDLSMCNLATLRVEPPLLFQNLSDDCKPIALNPRRFSEPDREFIDSKIQRMLKQGIIEPSNLPWRT